MRTRRSIALSGPTCRRGCYGLCRRRIGDHDGAYQNLEVSVQSSSFFDRREIAVDASIQIDTIFLRIVGINALTINRLAEAIEQSKNIEIAMVLDISSSMGGARID